VGENLRAVPTTPSANGSDKLLASLNDFVYSIFKMNDCDLMVN
jgi:hypothetical protein